MVSLFFDLAVALQVSPCSNSLLNALHQMEALYKSQGFSLHQKFHLFKPTNRIGRRSSCSGSEFAQQINSNIHNQMVLAECILTPPPTTPPTQHTHTHIFILVFHEGSNTYLCLKMQHEQRVEEVGSEWGVVVGGVTAPP